MSRSAVMESFWGVLVFNEDGDNRRLLSQGGMPTMFTSEAFAANFINQNHGFFHGLNNNMGLTAIPIQLELHAVFQ